MHLSSKVLSATAEGELPEFDLARKVGRKIALQRDRKAVVLCVLDVADFDGSLPRAALRCAISAWGGVSLTPPHTAGHALVLLCTTNTAQQQLSRVG